MSSQRDEMICPYCGRVSRITFSDFLIVVQECEHCYRQLWVQHDPRHQKCGHKPVPAKKPRKFRVIEGGKSEG